MNTTINRYYINLYRNIAETANPLFQYQVWVKGELSTTYVSSFDELYNTLFGDYSFDNFVDVRLYEYEGLETEFITKIRDLRYRLRNYDESNKTDAEIIEDPNWIAITQLAKEVKDLWPFEREEIY